jgi:hypothetical protein
MSTGDFVLFWKVKFFQWKEFFKNFSDYRKIRFLLSDLLLFSVYMFSNPYRVYRKSENKNQYGETPISTIKKICKEAKITKEDYFIEMGAGRGRVAFWMASQTGCQVIALEKVAFFHKTATWIQKLLYKNLIFLSADMTKTELPEVSTVLYLYGTCLEDEEIENILSVVERLKKGARVVTVSYSLLDYGAEDFVLQKKFSVLFPWGKTEAYLQLKRR